VTLAVQGMIFGIMLVLGIIIGMWADLLRFITRRSKAILTALLDLLFWAVVTCLVFVVLFNLNFLELRLYAFFSLGLGFLLYLKFCSHYVLIFYSWAFETSVKLIKWLRRIFRPLALPARSIAFLLDYIILLFIALAALIAVRIKEFPSSRQENPPAA